MFDPAGLRIKLLELVLRDCGDWKLALATLKDAAPARVFAGGTVTLPGHAAVLFARGLG